MQTQFLDTYGRRVYFTNQQLDIIETIDKHLTRGTIMKIASGRQTGMSTLASHLAVQAAINGKNVILYSHNLDAGEYLIDKVRSFISICENDNILVTSSRKNSVTLLLDKSTNSTVTIKCQATVDNLRQFDGLIVVDNYEYLKDSKISDILTMNQTPKNPIVMFSTNERNEPLQVEIDHQ
jgi:hypothetical protein